MPDDAAKPSGRITQPGVPDDPATHGFTRTKLWTKDHHLVTEFWMPPFVMKPDVVFWGTRVFARNYKTDEYLEAFAWYVPQGTMYEYGGD